MKLEKATVAELDDASKPQGEIAVQFNPTSLRLQVTNTLDPHKTPGRQVRQFIGSSSTSLTLDLIFDTADEGTTDAPRSVREKTDMIERFLRPIKGKGKFVAPRIRFHWEKFIFDGVVDTLTIELDHFAATGAPLRAKVSLVIKEQNRDLELLATGPGANKGGNAPTPLGKGGALGGGAGLSASAGIGFGASASVGFGASASIGVALDGESAGEFAARVGVDPAGWRGLQIGGESSLSLSAGVEVGFDPGLSAGAGLGVTLGVEAGASVSLEASFGLETNASVSAVAGVGAGAELASGFALASAGGVVAALNTVQTAKNQAAAEQTRVAFKAPQKALPAAGEPTNQAPAASTNATRAALNAQPRPPEQRRTPLNNTGSPTPAAPQAAAPAPRPPRADPRASSFGFGVPLRSTVGEAADRRAESVQGDVAVKPRIESGDPPTTSDPTTPAWVALPVRDTGRKSADKTQGRLRPARPCGCTGRCKH